MQLLNYFWPVPCKDRVTLGFYFERFEINYADITVNGLNLGVTCDTVIL